MKQSLKLPLAFFMAFVSMAFVSAFASPRWVMSLTTDDGWSAEDGDVTVQYSFVQNPVSYGTGLTLSSAIARSASGKIVGCCRPYIEVKIKNNSENFIYLDLSKTYTLRNGETELFQDVATMSTSSVGGETTKKTLSQDVMPIPPRGAKSLIFYFFKYAPAGCGYQPFILPYFNAYAERTIENTYYCSSNPQVPIGGSLSFNADNSPAIEVISIAYMESENAGKPKYITKEFYINEAWKVKNTKPKDLQQLISNLDDKAYFIILDTSK